MFIGLMVGGVLADRYERKKVILLARGTCGIGFIGLCLNALLPEPSLLAIYLLGLWDGFFASLGVTALLAATPALVGRENLMQAGAITMLTVRLGSVISPMLGGVLLATGGVAWNYGLAAAGTFHYLAAVAEPSCATASAAAARASAKIAAGSISLSACQPADWRHCAAWRSVDYGERRARVVSRVGD